MSSEGDPAQARTRKGHNGKDNYENLILLCPNHHTLVDKAEADHPVKLLKEWKTGWESSVKSSLGMRVP